METFESYIMCAFAASVSVGIAEILSDSENGLDRYVRFISSLMLLIILITPIVKLSGTSFKSEDLFSEAAKAEDYGSGADAYITTATETIRSEIAQEAAGFCGIGKSQISVKLDIDDGDRTRIVITKITITPKVGAGINKSALKKYISEKFATETVVSG